MEAISCVAFSLVIASLIMVLIFVTKSLTCLQLCTAISERMEKSLDENDCWARNVVWNFIFKKKTYLSVCLYFDLNQQWFVKALKCNLILSGFQERVSIQCDDLTGQAMIKHCGLLGRPSKCQGCCKQISPCLGNSMLWERGGAPLPPEVYARMGFPPKHCQGDSLFFFFLGLEQTIETDSSSEPECSLKVRLAKTAPSTEKARIRNDLDTFSAPARNGSLEGAA